MLQSFQSSLEHLRTTWIDSLVLHGPSQRSGLSAIDLEAWRAMEALADSGKARRLGVSNVSRAQLELLLEKARVAPAFVQNRCYASRGWDSEVRAVCNANGLRYQGFSLLTANPEVLRSAVVSKIARRLARTPQQVVFCFALQLGMLPLTGTSDAAHMREDLEAAGFSLEDAEVRALEKGS